MPISPSGWLGCPLVDIGIPRTPKVNLQEFPDEVFELWSVPNFPNGPELVPGAEVKSAKQVVQPGDVLLCKINPRINRVEIVREPVGEYRQVASTEWIVVRSAVTQPEFLLFAMRDTQFREDLMRDVSGVGGSLMRARPKSVQKILVPIAPLNEQRRIVAKIEAIQARSRRAREALAAVPPLLERFRQSVLAAAFRGDLTAEWRAKNPDVEPASELLERTRIERRRRWEESELAKMMAKGRLPKDDKWKAKYKEPESVDLTELPELPKGWRWAALDSLSTSIRSGTAISASDVRTEFPVLRSSAVRAGSIDFEDVRFLREKPNGTEDIVAQGDFLFTRLSGTLAYVGNCAHVSSAPHSPIHYPDRIFRARLCLGVVPRFFTRCFESSLLRSDLEKAAKSSAGHQRISIADLRAFAVPIPPEAEQLQLATTFDAIENSLSAVSALAADLIDQCDKLDQATLAKAFRGELVPQAPDDEPASELLERVQRTTEGTRRRRAKSPSRKIHKSEKGTGSTEESKQMLRLLKSHKGGIRPDRLREDLGISAAAFYYRVAAEIDKGTIAETTDDNGERVIILVP